MHGEYQVIPIDFGGHRQRFLARRDALVEGHLDLVRSIALGIQRSLPTCFELDDLVAVGNMALTTAATRYRPAEHSNAPFSAYARPVIRGAILDSVRRRAYEQTTRPGLDEADEPATQSLIETVIDDGRLRRRVAEAVAKLPKKQQAVLLEYYSTAEPSLRIVGERIGVSGRRAAQLHEDAIDTLKELLRSA